ncbi:uncharacterized protein DFL_007468 [Arthrobotrys flagrans]|uniref:F-box domain-containing protein n=1 Tax=Arthrobotrys flagrans TaxID=97331 RepID=A0A436ZWG5_ARTFL|nr:hypothetical protein DFL_007468 [Arthrobotrys flagrans]
MEPRRGLDDYLTTTLRECAQRPKVISTNAGAHHKTKPAGSGPSLIVSGLMSLPLEIHFMLLEDCFDAKDHSTLARVCKLWNHIMKTSRAARAKRYIDYRNEDQDPIDAPRDLKIHMALLMCQSEQYFFKDSTSLQDKQPSVPADAYRFSLRGPYPGLNIFAEDPIFIFSDQNSDKEGEAKESQTQNSNDKSAAGTTSIEGTSSDITDEPGISFSQSFIYKYQTTGMFPSRLGAGLHGSGKRITLTKSSKVGDYTEALVAQMKGLAKSARERRCYELSRSTNDKQIISLWERLTATDGEFIVQVNNYDTAYGGCMLPLTPGESQPRESLQNDLFLEHVLALNVHPPPWVFTRYPYSGSEDDD